MRRIDFIIFFSIVLTVYGFINTYIFFRGLSAVSPDSGFRAWYIALFWFVASAFFAGRFLERVKISWLSTSLVWIGSFWLAAILYLLLMLGVIDLVRLVNFLLPIFPDVITANPERTKSVTAAVVTASYVLILAGGHLNARLHRIRRLSFGLDSKMPRGTQLTLAVASDIHLGTIVCKSRFEKIVDEINGLQPDLILLPGDVVDEDLGPVIEQNLGETLRKLKSRYGVFAVTGNHEYIGGVEAACRYLTDHGITMLRDEAVTIDGVATVVGREDLSYNRASGRRRRELSDLVDAVDRSLPLILMDHQPFHLEEAERNGIDLQLSGHTHHGQLWPLNYITRAIYEVSWGYVRKGLTHIFVSCGVGTWGPPVRTGNRPEILHITLSGTP